MTKRTRVSIVSLRDRVRRLVIQGFQERAASPSHQKKTVEMVRMPPGHLPGEVLQTGFKGEDPGHTSKIILPRWPLKYVLVCVCGNE